MGALVHCGDVLVGSADGDAARVGVLDDGNRRHVTVVVRRAVGGVGVDVVVVRHLLAVQLLALGEAARVGRRVEGRRLVRVLAVAQARGLGVRRTRPVGEGVAGGGVVRADEVRPHPGGDCDVVGRGVDEGVTRQRGALLQCEAAAAHGVEHVGVRRRVGDDGHRRVILRGRAHHRRAADVDLLDALVDARARGDRLTERVEVHDDEVELLDTEVLELLHVIALARVGEDTGVHLRVQRLDATLEALGEARELLDRRDGDAETRDELARTARRDDLHPGLVQAAGALLEPLLVVHRDESPPNRAHAVTH